MHVNESDRQVCVCAWQCGGRDDPALLWFDKTADRSEYKNRQTVFMPMTALDVQRLLFTAMHMAESGAEVEVGT